MEHSPTNSTINRIGFIGNYLPHQCGIATFTTDLCEAIAAEYGGTTCIALPVVVARYPNVVYIILGATHPHVMQHEGETYRLSLQWLAQEKGVEGHVIFYNRFVSLEELLEFIGAADIYITPYLSPAQIISGTLAYTLGAGKEDFEHFERYGMIMPPEDKDAALFPRRIGGQWALIHRPVSAPGRTCGCPIRPT